MSPLIFPSRAYRRTRERASGLLFALGIDDQNVTPPTGHTLAFTRAGGRTVIDSTGRVVTVAHSQWPWSAVFNSVENVWEPTLDFQPASTNLCLQSENFGTTWAAISTPTRTAAAKACGDVALDLLNDTSAAALQGYSQAVTFTGNAVKALSLFVAQGSSTSSVVRLRDTTAAADRLLAIITWSGGVPSVTTSGGTGTFVSQVALANGVYRLLFQTTSVTAANTNQIEIYPATTSGLAVANTGSLYVGGVQAENLPAPSSYLKTTTATVARVIDALTSSITIPTTADFTVYARLARPLWAGLATGWSSNQSIVGQPSTDSNTWYLYYDPINQQIRSALTVGGAGVTAVQSIPATGMLDICAQYTALQTAGKSRLDVGSGFSAYSSTSTAFTAWTSTTFNIGFEGAQSMFGGIRKLVIASGARTLTQMRGVLV